MKRILDNIMDFFVAAFLLGFGVGFWLLLLVLAVGYARAADPLPVDAVVLQEVLEAELSDTVLSRGESVVVFDEMEDSASATIRVGDGTRAGGRTVGDPLGHRSAQLRELSSGEYALVPGGETVYTNGTWQLLPARTSDTATDREGTIEIVAARYVAAVTWGEDSLNTIVAWDESLPFTDRTYASNLLVTAREDDLPYPEEVEFHAYASNIVVYGYEGEHLLGKTNDLRESTVLVRGGTERPGGKTVTLGPDEAMPRRWFELTMQDKYAADWWRYIAGGGVSLNRHPLYLSSTIRAVGSEKSMGWLYRTGSGEDRQIMHATFGSGAASSSNQVFSILSADIAAAPVSIWISATVAFESAPVIQHVGSLISGDPWTNCATTTAWPETFDITLDGETRTTYLLQCANPGEGFFRVSGEVDSDAAISDYIAFYVADLRNTGTITAGQGFRVAVPAGGTNYVAGITTNLMIGASTLQIEGGIIAKVAASTNSFPAAGITTIADAATLELSGATGNYFSAPTTWRTNTLSIAGTAPAYGYSLFLAGTNPVALSADMIAFGDLPDNTSGRVFGFTPHTNSTWLVIGVAP